nr:uncharacterized protein LOC117601967 isoform X2 [Osmia lignaria]
MKRREEIKVDQRSFGKSLQTNNSAKVVVPKRAALLFDQLMVALQKVVDNQDRGELGGSRTFTRSSGPHLSAGNAPIVPSADEQTVKMDLQRRGQAKGRVYWRCYFNAVTCFKRK